MMTSTLALALTYFLVANPIGNSPAMLALLKDYDFNRQRVIIFREAMIALVMALFFQFFGEIFLSLLKISDYALSITGGLVLFMVAMQMIFHQPEDTQSSAPKREPFIVPIATPLISGPGLLTTIMVTSKAEPNNWNITLAILIAWVGVTVIMMGSPYLQKLIGKRGMNALEHVMGIVIGLISMEMIVNGALIFIKGLS